MGARSGNYRGWSCLAALGAWVLPLSLYGLDAAFQQQLQRSGKDLTEAYQGCLAKFPPAAQEQLRIAQRAWIAFDNKQEAATAAVGKRKGLTEEDLDRIGLPEVTTRTEMLRNYFNLPNFDLATMRQQAARADQELTVAYKQCLPGLAPDEEKKFRDAERAWIEYRDKDAHAHLGDPSGRAPVWTQVIIIRRRAAELQNFAAGLLGTGSGGLARINPAPVSPNGYGYTTTTPGNSAVAMPNNPASASPATTTTAPEPEASVATALPVDRPGRLAAVAETATPKSTPVPTPAQLDPAARDRLVADLKEATRNLLTKLASGSPLVEVNSLNAVKELPVTLTQDIATLKAQADGLRKQMRDDRSHEAEYRAELNTSEAALTLAKTTERLKAANAPAASAELSLFERDTPAPTDDQKPLWKYLHSLAALCTRSETEAKTHRQRAQTLSAAGKAGEALREYQEAFRLFPDPDLAQTIKRQREDSLGL